MTHELYKVHRPKSLDRVVGNGGTVRALQRMLDGGKVPHALLFSGPSGCGKTTLARILRRALDCHDMDFVDLNCAQARGVDTVREIQRLMNFAPTGKCRVWLLDEVHQLTKEAQHAALKMLEDTPRHVYFFLATTDPGKLLPTIRTRCTDLPVSLLSDKEVQHLVERVSKKEKIEVDEEVVLALVDEAGGSARRALVLLDKVQGLPPEKQLEALKVPSEEQAEAVELARALIKREPWAKVSKILRTIKAEPEEVRWVVLGYARAVLLGRGDEQTFMVLQAFENNFYDSKAAGLARACYEALHCK